MRLDFLEGLALRLGQQERRHEEVKERKSGERIEDDRVAARLLPGQEGVRNGERHHLVHEKGDGHAVGADAPRHELGQRKPDDDAWANGKRRHKKRDTRDGGPTGEKSAGGK